LSTGQAIVTESTGIRRGHSRAADAADAAREFHSAVAQPELALVVFFCSAHYDLDVLGAEMGRLFAGVPVVGCTTAGEIGPAGYCDRSISGASFAAGNFASVVGGIHGLREFDVSRAQSLTQDLMQGLESARPGTDAANAFALLLIDGLSVREEPVTRALQGALGEIALVGGSAGDGLDFSTTHVYVDGAFHSDSAALVLVSTPLPFVMFKTQHFVPTDQRVVVTAADAERRIVKELDGLPAAAEYARLVGADVTRLDPMRFAAQPVVVMIDGTNYVRSIQKANGDGSLTLFCAIEEGLVLRAGRGADLVENLAATFAELEDEIGRPQLILGCDCILRKLEISQRGLISAVESLLEANNVVGFNTYGEQYRGVHVNQTFTGIAIGKAADG
jgi:hypothetical protein